MKLMHRLYSGARLSRTLGLLLALAAPGCAYYNTFYLAKKHYREAIRAQERSLTDAPSPEASAKYDLVVRQCTKVVTEYPKSKYVDDASYMLGAALYGKGDYTTAIQRLSEFSLKFPSSPFVADARLTEGLARYRRKEFAQADSIFREVDLKYPKFPRRWELAFYAGENQSEIKRYDAAEYWYGRALDEAKDRHQRSDVLRRAGDVTYAAGRPDTAEVLYAQCLKVEDRGKQRLDVALSRSEALRDLRRYQPALDFLQEWKVFAITEKREGELMLLVNECLALVGRVQEAISGYRSLVDKFPRTSVAYDAQFRIGYLYESRLQDYDNAAVEYDKLKTQSTSEFASQAAKRSQNLVTMKQYRAAMATDTTQARAKAAFLLAELYYFQLEKQDSALAQYRIVEAEFPKSVFAPKSAYARLWIAAYDRQDTLGAMALTDTIASRYRGTRFAESALYLWKRWAGRNDERTALFDSLLANPDTSRTAWFEPEPELKLPAAPVDSTRLAMARQAFLADSVRTDSLLSAAKKWHETHQKGKPKENPNVHFAPSGSRPPASGSSPLPPPASSEGEKPPPPGTTTEPGDSLDTTPDE